MLCCGGKKFACVIVLHVGVCVCVCGTVLRGRYECLVLYFHCFLYLYACVCMFTLPHVICIGVCQCVWHCASR